MKFKNKKLTPGKIHLKSAGRNHVLTASIGDVENKFSLERWCNYS